MNMDFSQEQGIHVPAPKTYIAFVLDKSGSMGNIRDVAIKGFNDQLDSIKRESNDNTFVSLVTFNTYVTPIFFNRKVDHVQRLNYSNYQPSGWTALYDAVGYTITRLENESEYDGNTAFLVVIISDGYENHSVDYTQNSLANLIKRKQNSGKWTFAYVGANQDLSKIAQVLHIPTGNFIKYASTSTGTADAFIGVCNSVSNYLNDRKMGITSSETFSTSTTTGKTE